jgi:hypothetical protein
MRQLYNEHIKHITDKYHGPCFHFSAKEGQERSSGYIRASYLQSAENGCLNDSYSCTTFVIGEHQMSLDLEGDTQAYLVGDLAKEVYESFGVTIVPMFEDVAKGNRTGYHSTMCATSLTSLKGSLITDGTLAINEYRSDVMQLQLTRPFDKDGKESADLAKQYSCKPPCEAYPERKEYVKNRRGKKREEAKAKKRACNGEFTVTIFIQSQTKSSTYTFSSCCKAQG